MNSVVLESYKENDVSSTLVGNDEPNRDIANPFDINDKFCDDIASQESDEAESEGVESDSSDEEVDE